jgi:hypothetical protein
MATSTWIDKSKWERGPWDTEPDKVQWTEESTGLTCLIRRHPRSGHWCGYVGVSPSHPLQGKHYDDLDVEVHGGLTYAGLGDDDPEYGICRICHVPQPGEPEHLYWFGFDCGHCWDLSPGLAAEIRDAGIPKTFGEEYRNLDFVRGETEALARQLHALTLVAA